MRKDEKEYEEEKEEAEEEEEEEPSSNLHLIWDHTQIDLGGSQIAQNFTFSKYHETASIAK